MTDIVISKSYRAGKCIVSSVSKLGTRWMQDNMALDKSRVQATITDDTMEDLIKLMEADDLVVDVH